jgi:hypothetical protein
MSSLLVNRVYTGDTVSHIRPALWSIAPLTFSLVRSPLLPFPVWISVRHGTCIHTRIKCVRGGMGKTGAGEGDLRQIKTPSAKSLTGKFFYITKFGIAFCQSNLSTVPRMYCNGQGARANLAIFLRLEHSFATKCKQDNKIKLLTVICFWSFTAWIELAYFNYTFLFIGLPRLTKLKYLLNSLFRTHTVSNKGTVSRYSVHKRISK